MFTKKFIRSYAFLFAFIYVIFATAGCIPAIQNNSASSYSNTAQQEREYTNFTMGGIRIKMTGPEGYKLATQNAVKQAAALNINPPENVFAVFSPAGQNAPGNTATATTLRNLRYIAVSARPEFMSEFVDPQFFLALRKDLQRVSGTMGSDSMAHFQRLTQSYYKNQDSFSHKLGVFHSTRYSLSVAHIVREAESTGRGAKSSYSGYTQPQPDQNPELTGPSATAVWAKNYFAGAYHKILVQNVIMLNGRYFNIYFSAPLETENDINNLLEENRRYMNLIASAVRAGELNTEAAMPPSGPSASPVRGGELSDNFGFSSDKTIPL